MFYIEDGRDQFYQWDIDRKIVINDTTITQIHFCNRTDNCSLVVEVQNVNGKRVAQVPNILLQTDWDIRVYGYCGGCYTKHKKVFKVVNRTKPADYVYTETEVLNYSTLLERIEQLEENAGNPDVDLTGYVKNTDYADVSKAGVITFNHGYGLGKTGAQNLYITRANEAEIDAKENHYKPIVPSNLDYAVKSIGDGYYVKTEDLATANVEFAECANYAVLADCDSFGNMISLHYATKEELAAIGSGGSGGGSKVYTFDFNILNVANTITDADKAVLEELKTTGSKIDYALYVTDGSWITKITKIVVGNYIGLYLSEPYANIEQVQIFFNSDGTYKSCAINYASDSGGGWQWQEAYSNYISPYTYTHIKVVGYWDYDSNNITTYELSTSHNNTFEQESNTKYWVSKQYGSNAENIYFENNGGSLYIYDSNNIDLTVNGFTFLGYYYWG